MNSGQHSTPPKTRLPDRRALLGGALALAAGPVLAQGAKDDQREAGVPSRNNRPGRELWLQDFGADETGKRMSTDAFKEAVAFSVANGNKTIRGRNGSYRVDGTILLPQGQMIEFEGAQGSNPRLGSSIIHESNGDCMVWDGSGAQFAGTGGGLRNVLIVKGNGFSGGDAVKIIARSDEQRPGEMNLENILVYGQGNGRWRSGLVVDGTAADTAGARGVRHVHLRKCRFAQALEWGIRLRQVTHFFAQGLAYDPGAGGSGNAMLVEGVSDGIFINGGDLAGSVEIAANDKGNATNNFFLDGKVGRSFTCNDSQVNGVVDLAFSQTGGFVLVNRSRQLKCTSNINPAFMVVNRSARNSVTGDGTAYLVAFDAKDFDQGNNWGLPNNSFNALCAGMYRLDASVLLTGVTAAHTRAEIQLVRTGSATTTLGDVINPAALAADGQVTLRVGATVQLEHKDVVRVHVIVRGGPKSVGVHGAADSAYTRLSGAYLPT